MQLFSTNPAIPGIGGHVQVYTPDTLPALPNDAHYQFFLAFNSQEWEQNKDVLRPKLADHWVGDTNLIDCVSRGVAPEERWSMSSLSLPSITEQFQDRAIYIYRSQNHRAWIVVRTDLLDQMVQPRKPWWEQGIAIGTIYQQRFQESILDYCERVVAAMNAWEPADARDSREKKRIVSRFKSRWADLGASEFFEREDHKRRHAAIMSSIERAEENAQNDVEFHTGNEASRPTSIRTSSATPATNAQLLAGLAGQIPIVAIYDAYFDNKSLVTLNDLATLGAVFSPNIRILTGSDMIKATRPTHLTKSHLSNWFTERAIAHGEVRLWPAKGHQRRFILLDDGQTLILGCSLNDIAKDEVAHLDTNAADLALFDSVWQSATSF